MRKLSDPYLLFTAGIAICILSSSLYGLLNPSIYEGAAFNWQVQTVWQDYTNVFLIIPVIVLALAGIYLNVKGAEFVWSGALLYNLYTFAIYAFALHFNKLFLSYCLNLALSGWGLIWFTYQLLKRVAFLPGSFIKGFKPVAWFLLSLAALFYLIWLRELVPAILKNETPKTISDLELFTNPVQVLDLAFILPGFILSAILIFRKKYLGLLLGYPLLIFSVLMSLTIAGLQTILIVRKINGNIPVLVAMLATALIGMTLAFSHFKRPAIDVFSRNIMF